MEDTFFHKIIPYIQHDVFHESMLSLVCNHPHLKEIQYKINRKHSANILQSRFQSKKVSVIRDYISIMFEEELNIFLKYFTGILLNDEDMDIFTNTVFHTRGKISVSKYVKPKPRLIYNHVQKKWTTLEFNSEIVHSDKKICSVYRLDDVDKNIIKESRQVCALIY